MKRRVLAVDDSALSLAVIRRLLERHGLEVLTAKDGAEGAVVALRERPDLVVTDLEMPVMDGYQLARLLKSDPATQHVPVLILTSHTEASSRFWGLETGAEAYLVKDGLESELIHAVDGLLAQASPRPVVASDAPQTPLEALARVSRHLDSRLLEAVLVNRVLEKGMKAETLQEASEAILGTLSSIVDTWVRGLAVTEPEAASLYLDFDPEIASSSAQAVVEALRDELAGSVDHRREVVVYGGNDEGRPLDLEGLTLMPLPLRGAHALLFLVPKDATGWTRSRENKLFEQVRRHLALVVDNARLAQRLRELSMQDGLTRLLNRRTIHQRLRDEAARARRYQHELSVILCDLDHFKSVNDTYGHLAGDAVLVRLAELLSDHGRQADVAGRYGGEEFVIVLPETGLEQARLAAERLRVTIATSPTVLPDGFELTVTASLGVASISEIAVDAGVDDLLALADQRLYEAKDRGRNSVVP